MRETLYIRLGATPDSDVEYGSAGAERRTMQSRHGSLAEAAEHAAGKRVMVFVPGEEVRLTTVKVPAKQASKVMQAVPFALEDQVADDIDDLHFAVGARTADGSFPVAIIARDQMDAFIQALKNAGLRAEQLIPEMLALPGSSAEPLEWSGLDDNHQVIVRSGLWSGFSCAREDLPAYLSLAELEDKPSVRLFVSGAQQKDWSQLEWPLKLMPSPGPLHVLVNHHQPEHAINLLQGAYSQRQDLERHWKPWQLAASLLLALLLVSGAGLLVDNMSLQRQLEQQDRANVARFQQLFPDQQRIENLEAQLDQKIRGLSGDVASGPFVLMQSLSEALAVTPGLKLTGMQYRDEALYLSMSAKDLQVLEKLRAWFDEQADRELEVQSANAETDGAQIRARLSAS